MSLFRSWMMGAGLILAACVAGIVGVVVFWPRPPGPPAPAAGPPLFMDVTEDSGVTFTYRNGEDADLYTILESLGGGVALLDYDADGRLDIFLTGGGGFTKGEPPRVSGLPGRLYRNLGGWKFKDVTTAAGLADASVYTHGAFVADYDRDGRPDLLVTGYGKMTLYRNQGGQRFEDVTEKVGLRDDRWTTSAGWADLSGDGWPDLYVCRYLDWSFANHPRCPSKADPSLPEVCEPRRFQPLPHSLYRNDKGKFVETSEQVGLRKDGRGLGVVLADLNDDARPDIYVANDAGDNFLYLNRGEGRFEETGLTAGVAVDDNGRYNGSMGVDVGDYDGSGRPSLWVTNYQGEYHALYQNLGDGRFAYQSHAAGPAALGQQYVGFGTAFLDADSDGWLDLVFVNGHVLRRPVGSSFRQKPVLLRNTEKNGRRFFTDISARGGPYFAEPSLGRGLACGDLDNDGRPDLVISHRNSPVTLLRNVAGEGTHWLGVQLAGREGRPVVGAKVTVEAEPRRLARFARGGGSYLSSGDPRLLFGLGSEVTIGRVTVRWPWGETQHFDGLTADRYWELVEGEAKAKEAGAVRP